VGLNWDHLGFSGFITKKGRERRMKGGVFSCPRLKPQPQPPLTPKNLTLDPIYERERERDREKQRGWLRVTGWSMPTGHPVVPCRARERGSRLDGSTVAGLRTRRCSDSP